MVNVQDDLTGRRFGRLVVLHQTDDYVSPSGKTVKAQYLCQCDCGNQVVVQAVHLKSGAIRSCKCLMKETSRNNGKKCKKYNKYDLSGDYGIGWTSKGEMFCFDLEDYEKIENFCWCLNNGGYATAHVPDTRDTISMHTLVFGQKDGLEIDHINHNKCDNRKSNLRFATKSQNGYNKPPSVVNTSGIVGVRYRPDQDRWEARIQVDKKYYVKTYKTKEEAVAQRKVWEKEYCGEYLYAE